MSGVRRPSAYWPYSQTETASATIAFEQLDNSKNSLCDWQKEKDIKSLPYNGSEASMFPIVEWRWYMSGSRPVGYHFGDCAELDADVKKNVFANSWCRFE